MVYLKGLRSLSRRCRLHHHFRLSSGQSQAQTSYIDQWFRSIVKPDTFYEEHAESDPRKYFYNVDLQGRLFLEETLPKNIATSIKDARFLDFFFRMVRPIGPREEEIMGGCDISKDEYPHVSPCGKELNFIRPAATPIVFHTFDPANNTLSFAGSKSQDFRISGLALSKQTGRLYHRCDHLEKASAKMQKDVVAKETGDNVHQYALIRSAVVVSLSDQIGPLPADFSLAATESMSDLAFFAKGQAPHPIPWLPKEVESGKWAMPFSEDASEG